MQSNSPSVELVTHIVAGREIPVTVRTNTRAKRITLRMAQKTGSFVLTIPSSRDKRRAVAFLRKQEQWMATQLDNQPGLRPFLPGYVIPYLGADLLLEQSGQLRGVTRIGDREGTQTLLVCGALEYFERRVRDWLIQQAREVFLERAMHHAHNLDVKFTALRIRDQSSRWGSCSSNGTLSFSWRLVCAPDFVIDYLAAHEVAHLSEMNHSKAYWALVNRATPHVDQSHGWLKQHGRGLYGLGQMPDLARDTQTQC